MHVSIIIPCYNMAQWLPEAIESALAQTYQEKEVICVDDGSEDESFSVMNRYPIKVVRQANKGLAGARNAGIMNAAPESTAILPLDADDTISPDYLAKTVPLMSQGIGIVATDYEMFGVEARIVQTKVPTLVEQLRANHFPCCSLIRKSALLP